MLSNHQSFQTRMQNNNITQWRGRVWNALKEDKVTDFATLFPNAQYIRDASQTIWREDSKSKGTRLIDRVATIRHYINNGQPTLRCLMWLMETYADVYENQDIQYLIDLNECEMTKHVIVVDTESEYNGFTGKIIRQSGERIGRLEQVILDNNTDFDVKCGKEDVRKFNGQQLMINPSVQQGYREINSVLRKYVRC